jgi:beta-lactamase superfamily II metal-dependent hydrolase
MKLTIFQSDKGDCLLLSAGTKNDPTHVLIDGGMRDSFRQHVASKIARLPQLDLVYVSHIDEDHISGVLQLMDDAFEWLVHDHRRKNGGNPKKPGVPRPPKMRDVWHNAFRDQLKSAANGAEDVAIATSTVASGSSNPEIHAAAVACQELALSVPQGIQLSQRIGAKQLDLRLNQGRGKLLQAGAKQKPIRVGPMKFTLIGPFPDEIKGLKKEWIKWLSSKAAVLRVPQLRAKAEKDENRIASSVTELMDELAFRAAKLGDRKSVTPPNLASIMVLVEEDGRTLLLTGDGHHETILKGLERAGKMKAGGGLHVNVLKVQHHGSEYNLDRDFCRRVTADHYILCGNGAHENPDTEVLEAIIDSRLGEEPSANPEAKRKFKLWFNSHSSVTGRQHRGHMKEVEKLVEKRAAKSGGKMTFAFLTESAFSPLAI